MTGGALDPGESSPQAGHPQGAARQAPQQDLPHGMLWPLAAADGREGDVVRHKDRFLFLKFIFNFSL